MKHELYPFIFEDIFKEKVWGGRALEKYLNKKLPPGKKIGESWEISGYGHDKSVIANGPYRGKTLKDLVQEKLLGRNIHKKYGERFPLLVKFLDACDKLSVQVHPDDECARRLGEEDPGKTEAWYVIHAEPGAAVYAGLKECPGDFDMDRLLRSGEIGDALRRLEVRAGDVIGLPAGTVHAIGAGVLLAEVQQNSDNTYRLYDWGRMGLDGKPRELHVEKAKKAVKMENRPSASTGELIEEGACKKYNLFFCDKFRMFKYEAAAGAVIKERQEEFSVYLTLAGKGKVVYEGGETATQKGRSILVPAQVESFEIHALTEMTMVKAVPV